MEDKNKEVQLKEEELEKVSGGVPAYITTPEKTGFFIPVTEESDDSNITGKLGCHR